MACARALEPWTAEPRDAPCPLGAAAPSEASYTAVAVAVTFARTPPAASDRAGHPRPAQPAITIRVLGQVLLVQVLGVVERRRREQQLGGDRRKAGIRQRSLVGLEAGLRRRMLGGRMAVDRRAVLGADIRSEERRGGREWC